MNRLVKTDCLNPYRNLALEELLFDTQGQGMTLYLWRNRNTVVIGRNQNAWKECRVDLIDSENGFIARRTTGGGAVFHDVNNLNFTFIADKGTYDLSRQLSVILSALSSLSIEAEFSGRNDIITKDGAKFSGNAFRHSRTVSMQHGTLLVDVDMSRLSRYLAPSKEKLKSKGVDSVRSRVCNLKELSPSLTVEKLSAALEDAFIREYGEANRIDDKMLDAAKLDELEKRFASWEWRLGETPSFDTELERRFPWGGVQLLLHTASGIVEECAAYSDAMNEQFIAALPSMLRGCRYDGRTLGAAVIAYDTNEARDVAEWLTEVGK